jgi:hypothetical protein
VSYSIKYKFCFADVNIVSSHSNKVGINLYLKSYFCYSALSSIAYGNKIIIYTVGNIFLAATTVLKTNLNYR